MNDKLNKMKYCILIINYKILLYVYNLYILHRVGVRSDIHVIICDMLSDSFSLSTIFLRKKIGMGEG
jgi:hypothetical protein